MAACPNLLLIPVTWTTASLWDPRHRLSHTPRVPGRCQWTWCSCCVDTCGGCGRRRRGSWKCASATACWLTHRVEDLQALTAGAVTWRRIGSCTRACDVVCLKILLSVENLSYGIPGSKPNLWHVRCLQ